MSVHHSLSPGCEPDCHACRHRGWDRAASLAQKQSYLARVLARWADRISPVRSAPEHRRLGYRERVTLTARWDTDRGWQFGLVRRDAVRDELIAIHDCPVHDERVRALVRHLARTLPPVGTLPLAYLHVAGRQAVLIVKAARVDPAPLATTIAGLPGTGIEGLWLHGHPSAGRRLFARSSWRLAWGADCSRDAQDLLHGPTAFLQPLPELHDDAVFAAAGHLAAAADSSVLDLCCGHGGTLRRWTAAGARVLGVELSGAAVEFAERNAPDAIVLRGTCMQRLPQIREWWAAAADRRLAYVNPPRSGLERQVAEGLAVELVPERIAYLSCSAGTLARDLVTFEGGGYRVSRILPYDFFPQTHHVEALALLARA